MYAIYDNICHQSTPNVSIYTIHGSYGLSVMNGPHMYTNIDLNNTTVCVSKNISGQETTLWVPLASKQQLPPLRTTKDRGEHVSATCPRLRTNHQNLVTETWTKLLADLEDWRMVHIWMTIAFKIQIWMGDIMVACCMHSILFDSLIANPSSPSEICSYRAPSSICESQF